MTLGPVCANIGCSAELGSLPATVIRPDSRGGKVGTVCGLTSSISKDALILASHSAMSVNSRQLSDRDGSKQIAGRQLTPAPGRDDHLDAWCQDRLYDVRRAVRRPAMSKATAELLLQENVYAGVPVMAVSPPARPQISSWMRFWPARLRATRL
jgi:hypothetical protein